MALTYVSKKLGEPKHKLKLGITIVWCLTSYMFNHAFNQFVPIVFSHQVFILDEKMPPKSFHLILQKVKKNITKDWQ